MVTGSGASAIVQRFSYDSSGSVVSVDYSSNNDSAFTTYYYLRNGQGDVVKLIDSTGTTKVQYTYDSWGKLIATTGTLSNTVGLNNPFRYRGYVYDTETGWYYLQSRYYNPSTCRFISADVLLSTGQGVLGYNTFAYCLNNPVNMSDPSGAVGIVDEMIDDITHQVIRIVILTIASLSGASDSSLLMIEEAVYCLDYNYPPIDSNGAYDESGDYLDCASLVRRCASVIDDLFKKGSVRKQLKYINGDSENGIPASNRWQFYTEEVCLDEALNGMRPGDLIYWKASNSSHGHVAIYVGMGFIIDSTISGGGVSFRQVSSYTNANPTANYVGYARYIGG